jgi:hypothetical protein
MSRKISVLVLAAIMMLSVAAVSASSGNVVKVTTPDGVVLPAIADGRLNGLDIGAPVVIYYTYTAGEPTVGAAPSGVELLAVNQESNNGNLVLQATSADIQKFLDGSSSSLSANGYTLNYNKEANWFWITSPADHEGKTYSFAWENLGFPVGE